MSITNNEILMGARSCLLALLFGMFLTAKTEAQVLTNRTPDTAKIYPAPTAQQSPSPTIGKTVHADPLLFPPDKPSKAVPVPQTAMSYYIYFRGVNRVLISDLQGKVDDVLQDQFVPVIRSATYDVLTEDTVSIVVPISQKYSVTFESNEPMMLLEIVKGHDNVSPEEAIRYRDLVLNRRRAKFEITPNGIEPLRVDTNYNGRFDTLVEPTVRLRGVAARDTKGPEIGFHVIERSRTNIVISIDARDNGTGLKNLYYSLDGHHALPYQSPVRVELEQTSFIWAFAEDHAANRSASKFKF